MKVETEGIAMVENKEIKSIRKNSKFPECVSGKRSLIDNQALV